MRSDKVLFYNVSCVKATFINIFDMVTESHDSRLSPNVKKGSKEGIIPSVGTCC